MESYHTTISLDANQISRLGFRNMQEPVTFRCIRNGEALELKVYYFESRNLDTVIYYTDITTLASGARRHATAFRFKKKDNHELLHKYCLHLLFFDEQIQLDFESQNTFSPSTHLDKEKASQYLDAVKYYWNSRHFDMTYKILNGIESQKEIISLD